MTKPPHWPANVQYIDSYSYHCSVPDVARALIKGNQPTVNEIKRSFVAIRAITTSTHPAYGQYGLFATKKIPPNTHIIDYMGEIHCDDRLDTDYDISLYRSQGGLNIGIDAKVMGNEARFINDFRGIRHRPNATFAERRNGDGELRLGIWSSKELIKKGEEILVSYGKSWWRARSDQ